MKEVGGRGRRQWKQRSEGVSLLVSDMLVMMLRVVCVRLWIEARGGGFCTAVQKAGSRVGTHPAKGESQWGSARCTKNPVRHTCELGEDEVEDEEEEASCCGGRGGGGVRGKRYGKERGGLGSR